MDRTCQLCDARIPDTLDARAKYCSVRCRTARTSHPIFVITCERCLAPAVKRRSLGRFCSDACRTRQRDTDKDLNRRKNARRRLLGRSGRYKLADIAARDGHRCHLCNRKVDMSLSGDHKQGPTIDHLIPLADGGDDVASNVALAHRSCNCARGSRGTAQLRLVG